MTIEDLAGYIREFEAGGCPVATVMESRCGECDGRAFRVNIDDEDSVQRVCLACGTAAFIPADVKIDYSPSRHLLSQA